MENHSKKVLVDIVQLMNYGKVWLVMDNCHCHRDEDISDICSDIVQYRFIPPYSPNLNPIENIIGNIKNMRKLLWTEYRGELLDSFNLPWGQKASSREIILDSAFMDSLVQINPEISNNTYEHMRKYVSNYINFLLLKRERVNKCHLFEK